MKKLVILISLLVFTAPLTVTFASGSSWHRNQARARKAWTNWQKQESAYWKKFDAEMSLSGDENPGVSTAPVTNPKRGSQSK